MTGKDAFSCTESACKDKLKKYDVNEVKQVTQDLVGGRVE